LQSKRKKEGIYYFKLTEEIATKCNNYKSLFYVTNAFAIYHHVNKNYKEAIKKYTEAYEKYGTSVSNTQVAHLYWLLSEAFFLDKQYKDSYIYQEKYIYLKDNLFTIEKNKTFEKLQTEYEVEKKNNQISFLEKEKILETQRKKLAYSIGGLLLFILGLSAFIYRFKVQSQKLIRKQEQQLHLKEKEQLQQAQKLEHIEGFIQGEEKEKNRIAIELHDGIGGKLAGIKHFVSALHKTKETIALNENISEITKEVRLLSHSLSYTYSLQKPLKSLLEELQEQYKNHFTMEVILYPETEINAISNNKKLFLYRSIQELVNNCYKYAKTNHITISLTYNEELLLLVEDNGIGFDIHATANGIGLQNIKEKLIKFNGTFHIESVIQRGTTIIIKLPK